MNRKQYEAMRRKLMDEAQQLLDAGKAAEANAKMEEIRALDEQWDVIAQAAANLAALNGSQTGRNPLGEKIPLAWRTAPGRIPLKLWPGSLRSIRLHGQSILWAGTSPTVRGKAS